MAIQTAVINVPIPLLAGQLVEFDNDNDVIDCVVDPSVVAPGIAPGLFVTRTALGDRVAQIVPTVAALVSSIMTNLASSVGQQVISGASLNGATGTGRISPPAKITITTAANANWLATSATVAGLDQDGIPITDTVAIAAGGGTTATGALFFSRITSVTIPVQGGAAGTGTIGTSASVSLDGGDVLGITVHEHRALVATGIDNNEVYEPGMSLPVIRHGRVGVAFENGFRAGDVVHFRVAVGTGTQIGAARAHDGDSGTCIPCRRARAVTSGQPGDIGWVELNL